MITESLNFSRYLVGVEKFSFSLFKNFESEVTQESKESFFCLKSLKNVTSLLTKFELYLGSLAKA